MGASGLHFGYLHSDGSGMELQLDCNVGFILEHDDGDYFIRGDVVRGIEESAANITAPLVIMDNGRQNSTCS